MATSECICSIVEGCDEFTQRQNLQTVLNAQLSHISEAVNSSSTLTSTMNSEQVETLMNSLCSVVQPMLQRIGGNFIPEEYMENVVNLVINLFNSFTRVFSGGLFIIQGLTHAVEGRIGKYVNSFLQYIGSALDVTAGLTDESGMRTACGLISDFAICAPEVIVNNIANLIALLKNVLQEP